MVLADKKSVGRSLFDSGRFKEALPHFLEAISQNPNDFELYSYIGGSYSLTEDLGKAIVVYEKGLSLFPENIEWQKNIASIYIKVGNVEKALKQLYKLRDLIPDDQMVRENLRVLHQKTVPQWHFSMMNDEKRNKCFYESINKNVTSEDVVLEIGTGSGLLAMMAAKAGAKHVYTCEKVLPIATAAKKIINKNKLSDKITVNNKSSENLEINKDIPAKIDVLIAEILGTTLLEENIINVLNNLYEKLPSLPKKVIPCGAVIYGILIESPSLWKKIKVENTFGFDLQEFNNLYHEPSIQIDLKNNEYSQLSDKFEVARFDFTRQIKKEDASDISVKIIKNGNCHGVVLWYSLFTHEDIFIDTSPESEQTHWQQGFHPFELAETLKNGNYVNLKVSQKYSRISIHKETK